MIDKTFNNLVIGILGGGQLGRLLIQKAIDYSLNIRVLDPDKDAPCRNLAGEFVNGSFNDFNVVYNFGKGCDLLTIEIEHVNTEALEKLESEGKIIYPQPSVIKIVQDKGEQKLFFSKNNIPTAEYFLLKNKDDLINYKNHFPVMQKSRKGGYDGKGVFRISSAADIDNALDGPSVLEKLVPIHKEISVIVARDRNGETKCFPPVEMAFDPDLNLVEFLFSPAELEEHISSKAKEIATRVAQTIEITGLLAVEMFLTADDQILVNEIAPRPHNSGHHTIEANRTSQYEQLIRILLDLPLGNTDAIGAAVMLNLLGEKNHSGPAIYQSLDKVLEMDGVYVHLYGKKFTKPFRKMGHVTVTSTNPEDARKKAYSIKKLLKITSEFQVK